MTEHDDLDRLLGDWLAEGPARTPEPVLATAVQHARSHPRRPDPLAFLRRDPMAGRVSMFGVAPVPVFAALMLLNRPKDGVRPIAEATFAGLLVVAALFMAFNEGNQNWQAMWTCAIYLLLALTLWRARAEQIPR